MLWSLITAIAAPTAYFEPARQSYCEGEQALLKTTAAPTDQLVVFVGVRGGWVRLWTGAAGDLRVPLFSESGFWGTRFRVAWGPTLPASLPAEGCVSPYDAPIDGLTVRELVVLQDSLCQRGAEGPRQILQTPRDPEACDLLEPTVLDVEPLPPGLLERHASSIEDGPLGYYRIARIA